MVQNRMNHWIHLGHWNLNYLMNQSYLMIPIRSNFQMNRTNHSNPRNQRRWNHPMIHRWIQTTRMCPMSRKIPRNPSYQRTHSNPTSRNCHSTRNFLMNRLNRMSRCYLMSHWIRNIRWSLSCRFGRRNQSFRGIQEDRRLQRIRCCRSIPRSRLNPKNLTSHLSSSIQRSSMNRMIHCYPKIHSRKLRSTQWRRLAGRKTPHNA